VTAVTNSIVVAVLLGIFIALPCAAGNYRFDARENLLSGVRVARPIVARDDLASPRDVSTFYRTECGSCHVPYPPNLLSDGGLFSDTSGWKEIMDDLRNHFGENAELDENARLRIRRYLVDNAAGSGRRFGSRTNPARLTSTLWFHRTHGEVKQHFKNTRIGSPANCVVCHPQAEHWIYSKKEVRLPKILHR
jgi:hypothetical protein